MPLFSLPSCWIPRQLLLSFLCCFSLLPRLVTADAPSAPTTSPPEMADVTGQAAATDWLAKDTTAQPTTTDPIAAMLRLCIGLVVVLVVIVGLAWAMKKWLPQRLLQQNTAGQHVQVLETVSLGLKRQVSVLACQGRLVLIGHSEHGLHPLGVVPTENTSDANNMADFATELAQAAQPPSKVVPAQVARAMAANSEDVS